MEVERLQRLQNFAAEGNMDALFSELQEDPYILERIEQIPFVTTPLHIAASEGKIYFAKEILNLKPSFAWKRDHLGRSPLHLALEGKHQEVVTWLIKHDSELIRVKAKGMITPLHYAAQADDESNLADFLYVCPSSIEDLTVKCETAVHVALKKGSFKAFEILLGLLRRFNREEILNWEDEEGNNTLHTAVSVNQHKAVKLLIGYMKVNRKNSQGLTALDIFYDLQGSLDTTIKDILLAAKAKTTSELYHSPIGLLERIKLRLIGSKTLVEYFSRDSSGVFLIQGIILKRLRLDYQSINKIHLDVRNILLIVAILVATATYQAALSPPGGFWQDEGNQQPSISNTTTNIFGTGPSKERVGHIILASFTQLIFLTCNCLAFFMSVCLILILTTGLQFLILLCSTISLVLSFSVAIVETSFYKKDTVVGHLFGILLAVSGAATYYIPVLLKLQALELTQQGQRRNLRLGGFEKLKV